MTKQLGTLVVVRELLGATPYWVMDESLPQARARFKRLTGKFPSKKSIINVFTGTPEDLEKIVMNDDMCTISYSSNLINARIQ
jgi:hypothetical protein